MNICFACSEYPPGPHGGIGTLVQLMARGLVAQGHPVRVIGICPAAYPAPDYEVDRGVQVWRMRGSSFRLGWLLDRYRMFRTLASWVRKGFVDLIEVPDYGGIAAAWPRLPVPVISRLSGTASYFAAEMGERPGRYFYLERASLRRSEFLCSESRYVAARTREVFGLSRDADAVIYNPVEFPEEPVTAPRIQNRVVFAGTLAVKKGVISLIRSWPRIHEVVPDAELHLWGKDGRHDGGLSMRSFLQSLLPVESRGSVRFHDPVSLADLLKEFQQAAVAVLPSYAEGFALTPMHAMAAGCPTIYTSRGSGPEVIEHGRDGLLVDPDAPDEIANAVIRLLQDEGLARTLGAAGRRRIREGFSTAALCQQNESFYEECLGRFARSSLDSRN